VAAGSLEETDTLNRIATRSRVDVARILRSPGVADINHDRFDHRLIPENPAGIDWAATGPRPHVKVKMRLGGSLASRVAWLVLPAGLGVLTQRLD
jgi:hypothetical protein